MATLYRKCPKCGADSAGLDACAACGLIFAKYLKTKFATPGAHPRLSVEAQDEDGFFTRAMQVVFYVPEQTDPAFVFARALLLAAIAFYGVRLALMDIPSWEMATSLIHLPMVPIHEFGHLLFRPFGEFMTLLGGSLFQIVLPLIFGGIFLIKNRDPFAAAVMLWWSAVAVMDVAPYIYDAWAPQQVLLTGRTGDTGSHDFIDTLGDLGLLHKAQPIGRGVHAFGVIAMLTALVWGAWLVWQQQRNRKT
jgi:hypothetical protein